MTGTTIYGYGTVGVTLTSASQNPVTIGVGGTVSVSGVNASAIYGAYGISGSVTNAGALAAAAGYGVRLLSGGSVTNTGTAASITGALYGVKFGARGSGTVSNLGTIASTAAGSGMGVLALAGGTVTNGSVLNTVAVISGYKSGVRITGAGAYVSNFGTIAASGLFGSAVYLRTGGTVFNATGALLNGAKAGVDIQRGVGSVTNLGIISGTGSLGRGVVLQGGGSVVNGSSTNLVATIFASSRNAVYIGGTTGGSVVNYGTINSIGPANGASNGVFIQPGGTVTNGSANDTTALITATQDAVYLQGSQPSAVTNFGTIQSTNGTGINLYLGANVANGTIADTKAVISGITAIYEGGVASIVNMGTIAGTSRGVWLSAGGTIINGDVSATAATLTGATGIVDDSGMLAVLNFGTITGTTGAGAVLNGGGQVINGGLTDLTAAISAGGTAISAGQALLTVSNFGSISGGAVGVSFAGGGSVTNGAAADIKALISGGSSGVTSSAGQTSVMNFGTITGAAGTGVFLNTGAPVINGTPFDPGALISGALYGVRQGLRGTASVTNFGTIVSTSTTTGAGITLLSGGSIVNGASSSSAATISGFNEGVLIRGAGASVSNFGKITAGSTLGIAVYLAAGGSVLNGSTSNTNTSITGANTGIKIAQATGTIANFGTIKGTGPYAHGIVLTVGGTVANGSASGVAAYIGSNNHSAVYAGGVGPSYVTNYGRIKASGPADISSGVAIRGSGSVVNGSSSSTKATISGTRHGVYIQGAGASSVANFGTISSVARTSVSMYLGGTLSNGSNTDTVALITGPTAVYIGGTGSLSNFGTITSTTGTGVLLRNGGTVTNGSATDTMAMVNVGGGSQAAAAIYNTTGLTTITNFGTIASATGAAILLMTGGTITNGTTLDRTATIAGAAGTGIYLGSGQSSINNFGTIRAGNIGISFANGTVAANGTVYNAGTISNSLGTAGVSIAFAAGNNRLIAAPGATFIGTVSGAGSTTMELTGGGNGIGSISGFGTSFANIGSIVVDSGASWTFGKTNTITTILNNGTIFVAPKATMAIQTVDSASNGIFELNAGSILQISANSGFSDRISFLGAGQVIINRAATFGTVTVSPLKVPTYNGPLIQLFGTGDKLDLADIAYKSLTLNYTAASGLLQVNSGGAVLASLLFDKATLGTGTFHAANDGAGHTMITRS